MIKQEKCLCVEKQVLQVLVITNHISLTYAMLEIVTSNSKKLKTCLRLSLLFKFHQISHKSIFHNFNVEVWKKNNLET